MVVDVAAAAGAVGEGLGHVGGDGPVPLGVLAGHHLEEGVAVGGGKGVGVVEVDFVLPVGVLMVGLVGVPPDAAHGVHHVAQVAHYVGDALEVVAGLAQAVNVVGVIDLDGAVGVAGDQKMLRLDADVEDVALGPGVVQHRLEVLARAVGMRLAVHEQVAGEAGQPVLPRHWGVGIEVNAGQHIVGVRPLAHAGQGRAGETGPLVQHILEMLHRHHLDLGRAVEVNELRQDEADAVLLHGAARFPVCRSCRRSFGWECWVRRGMPGC